MLTDPHMHASPPHRRCLNPAACPSRAPARPPETARTRVRPPRPRAGPMHTHHRRQPPVPKARAGRARRVQVVGAPLAAALLHLDGVGGLRGWQWLFIAEGLPTIVLGIAMPCLLPGRPAAARWLDQDEANAVQHEVDVCRAKNAVADPPISRLLVDAFSNSQIYVIGVVKFTKDAVTYGCMFWAPLLIRDMLHRHGEGADTCETFAGPEEGEPETGYLEVLLTGIPYTLAAMTSICVSWHSQVRPRPLGLASTCCHGACSTNESPDAYGAQPADAGARALQTFCAQRAPLLHALHL